MEFLKIFPTSLSNYKDGFLYYVYEVKIYTYITQIHLLIHDPQHFLKCLRFNSAKNYNNAG